MKRFHIFILLFCILIIASFFRLYHIKNIPPGLYPDEAMNGNNALASLDRNDFDVFYPENNGREGLFINIQALFLKVLGNEPWTLRLVSTLFGVLTVLGLYFLGRELFSPQVGLLGSFLLAANFWHINFSRTGFRAIMAPAFLVWGIYFLLIALRRTRPKIVNFYAALGGVVYGLGMHSYIAYRATPVIIFFIVGYMFWLNKDKLIRKKILIASACWLVTAFLVSLPLLLYFAENPADFFGRTSQLSIFSSEAPLTDLGLNTIKTLGMFNFVGDWNWRHNYAGAPELFWPVGILFILGVILGIKELIQNSKFEIRNFGFSILFVWFLVAMIPVVISNEGLPHALRAILMIPPVILLSAFGGMWVLEIIKRLFKPVLRVPILSLVLLLLTLQGYYAYFEAWDKNPNVQGAFAADYVALGRELNSLPVEIPKYVIVNTGGVLVNGVPMPAQTVMFITDTYTREKQRDKNIYYVIPETEQDIPDGSLVFYLE